MTENSRQTSKAAGIAAITAVNFSWGLDFIFIEYATEYISPQLFSFIRIVACAVVMVTVTLALRSKGRSRQAPKLDPKDIPRFMITGAVGCSLYFTAECIGTDLTSAAFSSLIMAFVPVIGMLFDRIFFANRLTPLKIACGLISVAGVYLVVSGSPLGINLKGTIVMLTAACLWAGYIAMLKPLEEKYSETQILTGIFASGAVFLIPILMIMGPGRCDIGPGFLLIIIASAVLFIILGNYGYIFAVGRLSVSTVAMFENILPLTSVIFSAILLGSTLAPVQLAGGALIIASTTVLTFRD